MKDSSRIIENQIPNPRKKDSQNHKPGTKENKSGQKNMGAQKYTKEKTQAAIATLKKYGKLNTNQNGYQEKLEAFISLYDGTKFEANKTNNKKSEESFEKKYGKRANNKVAEKLMASYSGAELIKMMSENTIDKTIRIISQGIKHENEGPQIKPV